MRILSTALALLLVAACSTPAPHAAAATATEPVYRHIVVGPGVVVRLGEPVPAAARPYLASAGDGIATVRPGTFSGAEGIWLRLGTDGQVTSIAFLYDPDDESFEEKLKSFGDALGAPERREKNGARAARWQDERTRFEVVERKGRLESFLTDLDALRGPAAGAGAPPASASSSGRGDTPGGSGRP